MPKHVNAGVLDIAYEEGGTRGARPVVLLHGFPYDAHAYEEVIPLLAAQGCHVIAPYLRGYGPTRFRSESALRSGQQAALGHDLLALMDALDLPRAVLAGYDWGGRAACIVAALWPERVEGLVSGSGYNIQNIPWSMQPVAPELERLDWYQYYFHSERGRAGLTQHRRALCRLLWKDWSPHWAFDEATFERTAASFENPDFVEIVIHSYRHRFGLAPGDPALEETERRLAAQPVIAVPTVVLDGGSDGVDPVGSEETDPRFTDRRERRVLPSIGHNLPQEAPAEFAAAVLSLVQA